MVSERPRAGRLPRPFAFAGPALRGLFPGLGALLLWTAPEAASAAKAVARARPAKPETKAQPAKPETKAQPAKPETQAQPVYDPLELEIPNNALRPAPRPAGAPLTLRDLVQRARLTDPRARQAVAQLDRAEGRRGEASWIWFPAFDYQIGAGGPTTPARLRLGNADPNLNDIVPGPYPLGVAVRSTMNAILPLYTFGKIDAGNAAAVHGVKAQDALLERTRQQTAFDVTRAYWGYQTTHFGLASIESVRRQIADAKKRARELIDEGSDQVTRADVTRIDYVAEEVEAQHAGSVKNEALAVVGIKLLLGLEPQAPLEIVRQELPQPPQQPDFEEMVKLGLSRRPETIAARENVLARLALVDLEVARYYPDFGLIGNVTINYQSNADSPISPFVNNPNSRGGFIALGMRGTLDIPQKNYRVRQVEADLHEAQALLAGSESLLRLELQQALGDLAEARVRAQRYSREAAIGKQLLVQAALAFDSGLGTAPDLVLDTFLYSRATGEQLRALFDAQIAWASLERAVGTEVKQIPGPPPPPGQAPASTVSVPSK
ncbi:MAG TPA: TolC family protein [Myxococcales bacterium]|nr:TolC family protein [Myxococcales bacterium]